MPKETYLEFSSDIICYRSTTAISGPPYDHHPFHRHNGYEIYFIEEGKANFFIESNGFALKPGDLIIASPEQLHRVVFLCPQTYTRAIINIKKEYIDKLSTEFTDLSRCFNFSDVSDFKHIHFGRTQREEYRKMIDSLIFNIEHQPQQTYGRDLKINNSASSLLLYLNEAFENNPSSQIESIMPTMIKQVMEYIQAHLSENITLSVLENEFYLSGKYISSQFKRHTGLTLRAYILDQRVAFAKKLLQNGANVSEACYNSGFSDYANFIRTFTNIVGISPGKYARESR